MIVGMCCVMCGWQDASTCLSVHRRIHANPGGELGVWQFAGGHSQRHHHGIGVTGGEDAAVQAQEKLQRDERGALVAVDEGVVAGDCRA
jgi:hypothetical protein